MSEILRRPSLARALIKIAQGLRYQYIIRTGRVQMENDPWHVPSGIGDDWQFPHADVFRTVEYRMTPDGFVIFRGFMSRSTTGLNSWSMPSYLFTLPADWRPYELEWHSAHVTKGSGSDSYGAVISFDPTGVVHLRFLDNDATDTDVELLHFDTLMVWAGPS